MLTAGPIAPDGRIHVLNMTSVIIGQCHGLTGQGTLGTFPFAGRPADDRTGGGLDVRQIVSIVDPEHEHLLPSDVERVERSDQGVGWIRSLAVGEDNWLRLNPGGRRLRVVGVVRREGLHPSAGVIGDHRAGAECRATGGGRVPAVCCEGL